MEFCPAYNLYQLTPSIYLIEIDGNDDLAYTFLRVQEFYESVNSNFRKHEFTIEQYKEWYCANSDDGTFSYSEDWAGFNVPSCIINECYDKNTERTDYDIFFLSICAQIELLAKQNGYNDYYLCGVRKGDTTAIEHEIAHGLFATNNEYKEIMSRAIADIDSTITTALFKDLTELGYASDVLIDEAQAYLSTGLLLRQETNDLLELSIKFNTIFKEFLVNCSERKLLINGIVD